MPWPTDEKTGLTNRQMAFVDFYISNGFNAKKAATDAGYSERSSGEMGYENINKPQIRAYMRETKQLSKQAALALHSNMPSHLARLLALCINSACHAVRGFSVGLALSGVPEYTGGFLIRLLASDEAQRPTAAEMLSTHLPQWLSQIEANS